MPKNRSVLGTRVNDLLDVMDKVDGVRFQVLFAYVKCAGEDGLAWPSNRFIADKMGHADVKHVQTAKKWLVDNGYLTPVHGGGGKQAATFRINLDPPPNRRGVDELIRQENQGFEPPPERGSPPPPNQPPPESGVTSKTGVNPPPNRSPDPPPNRGYQLPTIEQPKNSLDTLGAKVAASEPAETDETECDESWIHRVITPDHPSIWNRLLEQKAQKLITAAGRATAEQLFREALARGADEPLAYALRVHSNEKFRDQERPRAAPPSKAERHQQGVAAFLGVNDYDGSPL